MTHRPVAPVSLRGVAPKPPGELPQLVWVDPAELRVDETYQRALASARSTTLIRKIVAEFDWARFKPPAVVESEEGYDVIDGQHTAVAALSHPDVNLIPVLLHPARSLSDRAGAFVSHNRDRLAVTPNQMHHSAAVAGDPAALAVERVCAASGTRVLRSPQAATFAPGDVVAVGTLRRVLRARGEADTAALLRLLASRSPVTALEMRALELLMFDPDFRARWDPELAGEIVAASSDYERREAEAIALTHERPLYRALAVVWYRRFPAPTAAPTLKKQAPALPGGRTVTLVRNQP